MRLSFEELGQRKLIAKNWLLYNCGTEHSISVCNLCQDSQKFACFWTIGRKWPGLIVKTLKLENFWLLITLDWTTNIVINLHPKLFIDWTMWLLEHFVPRPVMRIPRIDTRWRKISLFFSKVAEKIIFWGES